jgi:uncharacterized membrane protein YkvA (DUF1232 family)
MLSKLRLWAQKLKSEIRALWFALRDPRVPLLAKILTGLIVAYAASPIDLIPDFIPVLGLLDDLLLLPLGIYLAVRLIPKSLMLEFRQRAEAEQMTASSGYWGVLLVIAVWAAIIALGFMLWLN